MRLTLSFIAAALLSLGAATTSAAQPTATPGVDVDVQDDRDDGFDAGWFGLIGLAGLLGLRRADTRDRTTRSDATISGSVR